MFSGKRKMYGNFFIFETGKDQYSFSVNLIFPHRKNRENLFPPHEQKKSRGEPRRNKMDLQEILFCFLGSGSCFFSCRSFLGSGSSLYSSFFTFERRNNDLHSCFLSFDIGLDLFFQFI